MNHTAHISLMCFFAAIVVIFADPFSAHTDVYDPLSVSEQLSPQKIDLRVYDAERKREIPIRVYLPLKKSSVPVILLGHGMGGLREGNGHLGNHWSGCVYGILFHRFQSLATRGQI
jgi:predicted dienelactone hydrolase